MSKTFPKWLRKTLNRLSIRVYKYDIPDKTGVSCSVINGWLYGNTKPNVSTLIQLVNKLSNNFNQDPDELLLEIFDSMPEWRKIKQKHKERNNLN
jgi:transcriptional regulator with XRE-family HTH domain